LLDRQPTDQIPQLTGLRAVGSIMVVLYHFHASAVHPIFQPLLSYGGGMGVALFFALSGYILTLIYAGSFQNRISRKDYATFIWRRIARIYPLHLVFLLFVVVTYPTFVDPALSGPRQLVLNLLMMQAWTFDPFSFVQASWSISIEFLFYLLFPFIVRRLTVRRAVWSFFILATIYAVIASEVFPMSEEVLTFTRHRIFGYGSFFVLGCYVAKLGDLPTVKQIARHPLALAICCGLLVLSCYFPVWRLTILAFILPALVLVVHHSSIAAKALGSRVAVYLGDLSYSIYLSHQLAFMVVALILQALGVANPVLFWLAVYTVILSASALTYHCVEVPARAWLRKIEPRRSTALSSTMEDRRAR
jgi:peptidoglycan/LPS O-acetylase OafA/YrhL